MRKAAKKGTGCHLARGVAAAVLALACAAQAVEVAVDAGCALGPVKPVNGVGQPPMLGGPTNFRMMHYLKEAGIPFSRLHDVGGAFGGGRYVDIPNVFPDFDADENDPKSYDFAFTDRLMESLVANGVEPFYRLGVTIENHCTIRRYRIDPPKDYAKWARICEHVIRHYNEGWANGHRMNVRYWEIWNEPENMPDPEENQMWHAPFSEYIRFYGVVAPYLKARFPQLKIGGYASCGFYAASGCGAEAAAKSTPRTEHFIECFTNFLAAVRANGWPLDYFSYHTYVQPGPGAKQLAYGRRTLDEYGFKGTELICNEWLCNGRVGLRGTARQAAGIAAALTVFQNGPCDSAMIYDARCGVGNYSPLFNPLTEKPHLAYHVFMAFNELRRLGTAIKVSTSGVDADAVFATAARGEDGRTALLAVNYSAKPVPLSLKGMCGAVRCRLIDDVHMYEEVPLPTELPPNSTLLVMAPGNGAKRILKGNETNGN